VLLTDSDWQALWLTLQLAGLSTALLMLLGPLRADSMVALL
jgi:molybdate transport system permease protein